MKVLMSAYACEPHKGSEPAVGWNWAKQAARYHEVWVLTRSNNQSAIESGLSEDPIPNLHIVFHDLPPWARRWKRGNRGISLYYFLWQLTAIPVARKLHKQILFDVGHHVTLVAFRFPSFFAWLGIPYIWGPVGGGERAPSRFYFAYGLHGIVKEAVRDLSNVGSRIDPFMRVTAQRAATILVTTSDTAKRLPKSSYPKVHIMPAIGVEVLSDRVIHAQSSAKSELKLIFVGNLLYWKGLQLAVHAVAEAIKTGCSVELTIVGEGPFRSHLEQLAYRLQVAHIIHFIGKRSMDEVQGLYRQHDVLIFPSFHDSGGFVVLEAMAAGLPVICLDIGGPGVAVTEDTGIRVKPCTPNQATHELAGAITRLALEPETRGNLGNSARQHAAHSYNWDRKGDYLNNLYGKIAGAST